MLSNQDHLKKSTHLRKKVESDIASFRAKLDADVSAIRKQETYVLKKGGIERFTRFAADLPMRKREMEKRKEHSGSAARLRRSR